MDLCLFEIQNHLSVLATDMECWLMLPATVIVTANNASEIRYDIIKSICNYVYMVVAFKWIIHLQKQIYNIHKHSAS